jgi:hypothetical protein
MKPDPATWDSGMVSKFTSYWLTQYLVRILSLQTLSNAEALSQRAAIRSVISVKRITGGRASNQLPFLYWAGCFPNPNRTRTYLIEKERSKE